MKPVLVIIILFFAHENAFTQTTLFYQGFEGSISCSENWGYVGGVVNSQTSRTGLNSARVGRLAESNAITFSTVNVASLSNVQLQVYHSVRSGSGPAMDTREGADILVSINGGIYVIVGSVGGSADNSWTWANSLGGTTNSCPQTYTMPNPLLYNVPIGANTISIKIIAVANQSGSNAAAKCINFQNDMANGTAGNYDRSDEGFFVDDVKLTTTSTAIPGIWTGAVSTDWFNCMNWNNNKIPNSLTDVTIDQSALNDCIVDFGGNATCRNITVASNNGNTPDLIVKNVSTLNTIGNLFINKSAGSGITKAEILSGSTFTCNNLTLNGSGAGLGNASFINEYNINSVTFNGDFNLNLGGELDMTKPGDYGILNLKGNYNNNSLETDFKQTNSFVNLIGANNQIINTNSFTEVFSNLVINKSAGTVTLSDNINIETQLRLQNGLFDLNGNTAFIINSFTTGVLRNNGGVVSENVTNTSKLLWQIGTQNGLFTFPFSRFDGTYIPLLFSHTTGDAGILSVSTYGTAKSNLPWPTLPITVFNLNNVFGANDSDATVNRFWQLDISGTAIGNLTFNYAPDELPASPFNNPSSLKAQLYNSLSNTWQTYVPSQSGAANFVTISAFNVVSGPFAITNVNSPLPIELLSFDAKVYNKSVQLNWVTLSETNNDYFNVERSKDGINFDEIGKVAGAGNSNSELFYELIDPKPLPLISYYRLKQTDFDGKYNYSKIIAISINKADYLINVFPNPVTDKIFLNLPFEIFSIAIYDSEGKKIKNENNFQSNSRNIVTIDVNGISSGLYFLRITSENNILQEKIMIKR